MSAESSANLRDQINFKAGVDQANKSHSGSGYMEQNSDYRMGEEKGALIEKMRSMESSIQDLKVSFTQFTAGLGARVEVQGKDLAVLQDKLKDRDLASMDSRIKVITTVGSWVLVPAFGAVVTAVMYLILKKTP